MFLAIFQRNKMREKNIVEIKKVAKIRKFDRF